VKALPNIISVIKKSHCCSDHFLEKSDKYEYRISFQYFVTKLTFRYKKFLEVLRTPGSL
jgi:hypothetical protein